MDEDSIPFLDLRQLYYFAALAEHRTVSSAAQAVGLAQPTLSENIHRLEKRLGIQLVIRGPQGLRLTEAGVALAAYARDLIKDAQIAVREVRRLGGAGDGLVSVGLGASLAHLLSGPLAETILHELPHVKLRITELMSVDVQEWLEAGMLDLGCVYDTPSSATLSGEPIFDEELSLITAPDSWDGPTDSDGAFLPVRLGDLAGKSLVMSSPRHNLRKVVERATRMRGFSPNVAMEMDSLAQTVAMVARGSVFAILPSYAAYDQLASGEVKLVPIIDPQIRRKVYVVRKIGVPTTQVSIAVEEILRATIVDMIARRRIKARLLLKS